jgi:hypothetical protein
MHELLRSILLQALRAHEPFAMFVTAVTQGSGAALSLQDLMAGAKLDAQRAATVAMQMTVAATSTRVAQGEDALATFHRESPGNRGQPRNGGQQGNRWANIECWVCHKRGHPVRDCKNVARREQFFHERVAMHPTT